MSALVTAVMITGKDPRRRGLARAALQSFLLQTYRYKELLVINDSEQPLLSTYAGCSDRLREAMVEKGKTLGELRNIGLAEMRGDYAIQWDDDDWSHPERIATQMAVAAPATAVTLSHQVRYSFLNDNAFVWKANPINGRRLGIMGTVLHPRTKLRYPAEPKREDTLFLQQWPLIRVVENGPQNQHGPELYLRFCHDCGNTWSPQHIMRSAAGEHRIWDLPGPAADYLRQVLREHYSDIDRDVDGSLSEVAPAP